MKRSATHQKEPERPKMERLDLAGATELIRSAERFIASGKLALAQEQLSVAQVLDPDNRYIPAILDRIKFLQQPQHSATPGLDKLPQESVTDTQRYLSLTVGTAFKSGVKGKDDQPTELPSQLQQRIRRLTNAAENFLESGALKNAFESLMKAYLLDPMSPYVIACERTVLPEWKRVRSGGASDTQADKDVGQESVRRSSSAGPER